MAWNEGGLITQLLSYNEEQKKWGYFSYVEGVPFDDFLSADKSDRMKTLIRNLPFGWTLIELNKDSVSDRQKAVDMIKNDFKLKLSDFEKNSLKQWVGKDGLDDE